MKLNEILKQPERDLSKLNEKEKRDLAMNGIEDLIETKKEIDKKQFMDMFGDGLKLNLGCGNRKKEGFINIDSRISAKPDVLWNLENGIPRCWDNFELKNDSVTGVYASHILEHIHNLIPLMENIYKVCKDKAKFYISVPYFKSTLAFSDPTHVRYFTEHTFEYFSQEHRKKNLGRFDYDINCDFNILDIKIENDIMNIILEVVKCQEKKKKTSH